MNNTDIVQSIFAAVDQRDAESFAAFFTEDGVFRFANQNLVIGKAEIQSAVAGFFQSLKSIEHTDIKVWVIDDVIIINGWVNYTRLNNTCLKVPFATTWAMENASIKEYHIFIDNSEL